MEPIKTVVEKITQNLTTKKASDETKQRNCVDCFKEFTLPKWGMASYEIRCAECLQNKNEYERNQQLETFEKLWRQRCPKQYQETDITRLPCQEQVRRALDWTPASIGLLLYGATRTGKTRTAWLVLRNCFLKRKSFEVLNSLSALDYAAKYSESAAVVASWVDRLISCDVLLMDDIFKNKLTDSFEGIIFSLIDQRIERDKPIILVANDTGATLADRMTQDRGEPLVARLREFCLPLHFKSTAEYPQI